MSLMAAAAAPAQNAAPPPDVQQIAPAPNVPGTLTLTGQARARGFILEGYGVFFDVEIPSLLKSVVWSMQNMERDLQNATQTLQSLREAVDSLPSGKRQQYLQALRQLESQAGPA